MQGTSAEDGAPEEGIGMANWCGCGRFIVAIVILVTVSARAEIVCTYGDSFDLRIPADPAASKGWMEDATIDVPDHFIIGDVDVTVSITHTNVFDLQLFLQSPAGTAVLLNMFDPFTGYIEGEDYSGTTFDDEATTRIEDALPPFSGTYRPLEGNSLSAFDGEDAYGRWTFSVYDAYYGDTGTFDSFTLAITTPEPTTIAFLALGLPLTRRFSRKRTARR
jgi:subtilisin-like proprotein convertase family protein